MVGRWAYDFMYRRCAPWERGARPELVSLVTDGTFPPGRGLQAGEEQRLFGHAFDIVRHPESREGSHQACFVMTRR